VKRVAKRAAATAAALSLLAVASTASAELVARGDLFVSFQGGLSPQALPRHALAPITVSIDGTIKTLSGESPPALRQIQIELNRHGVMDTEGLATCSLDQIASTSDTVALSRCGSALVGRGSFLASTDYPEQVIFPTSGKILAFNGKDRGRPVIFAHVYGTRPLASTRIITFRIQRKGGAYGTVLTGALPPALNRYGFIKNISLKLHRNYRFKGVRHSYLSAGCPAPKGFPGAIFPFARASMSFADGQALTGTLTRSCRVKG
jgi:hypothetical protein